MKAIITGAGSGIGRELAIQLSAMGMETVLVGRRVEPLQALAAQLPQSEVFQADLGEEDACLRLFEAHRDADVVINNAGFGLFGEFTQTDLHRELNMIQVNVQAVHLLTKLYVQEFVARGSGKLLNVASAAAFMPGGPLMATYYATKAYVLNLTRAVAEELHKQGMKNIVVSALCPGPVKTDFDRVAGVHFSLRGLDSRKVAVYAVKKLWCGKRVIVPGLTMKLARFFGPLLGDRLQLRSAYAIQHRKKGQ